MDADANSSTVTLGRLAGFGGAPNMGHDPRGRRHSSAGLARSHHGEAPTVVRGRKLVVQLAETFKKGGEPTIVESLDAVEVGKNSGMPIAPVMIYGDDVSHVVTEEGIAYLYKAEGAEERRAAARRRRRRNAGRVCAPIRKRSAICASAASSPIPKDLGVQPARRRSARCWPRAVSKIWSPGRADCTSRRRGSELVMRHSS